MKKILCVILSICIFLCLCGCTEAQGVLSDFYNALTVEQRPHIGFSSGTLFDDSKETVFEATEIGSKITVSSEYRADLFYNTLESNEKTVYTALEYAMENGYSNILIDDLLVSDSKTLEKILHYISLDSPLLEQNLRYETGDFNTYYDNGILGNAAFDGFYITVKNFTPEFWNKKLEAVEKAKEIIAQLPDDLTPTEKADSLYRTVASADYFDYNLQDNENVFPYLYDALITGKTHCDGYTNAISLLYNMVGIECVEKNYTPTDEEIGHTWNFFRIDEKWYNCDATGGNMIPLKECGMGAGYLFGFSNMLQKYTADYGEFYPVSDEGLLIPIDAHISSSANKDFLNSAIEAFPNHGNNWALIVMDACNETEIDTQVQKLADRLRTSVQYYLYPLKENRTAVFVCEAGLCQ